MKRILIFVILLTAAVSCKKYDVDEILIQRDDISMTIKGNVVFTVDPLKGQIGYNDKENEFRMYGDDIGNWLVLRCRTAIPEKGHDVKADIRYTASTTTRSYKNVRFNVKRRDSEGKIWLWSDDEKIGLVVKEL